MSLVQAERLGGVRPSRASASSPGSKRETEQDGHSDARSFAYRHVRGSLRSPAMVPLAVHFGVVFGALLLSGCAVNGKLATDKPVEAAPEPARIPASIDLCRSSSITMFGPARRAHCLSAPKNSTSTSNISRTMAFKPSPSPTSPTLSKKESRCLRTPLSFLSTTVGKINSNMAFRYCRNTMIPRRFMWSPIISTTRIS
jgi:hypothetical protein